MLLWVLRVFSMPPSPGQHSDHMCICPVSEPDLASTFSQELPLGCQDVAHLSWLRIHFQRRLPSASDSQGHRKNSSSCSSSSHTHDTRHLACHSATLTNIFILGTLCFCMWSFSVFHHGTCWLHFTRFTQDPHSTFLDEGPS